MPELPEVENVCNDLKKYILGSKITFAKNLRPNLRIPFPNNIQEALENKTITNISRRSKYILIHLDNATNLVIHLGMSGRISIISESIEKNLEKHTHFIASFNNNLNLLFTDHRRFGLITVINDNELQKHKLFKDLGPEPFTDEFNFNYFKNKLSKLKQPIKTALMDNKVVVGVGNIYASESLFLACINPKKLANTLTDNEITLLINCIRTTLQKAINAGGSTLRDYKKTSGEIGNFQTMFNVYGLSKNVCGKCTTGIIETLKMAGRATYFCPTCQK